MNANPHATGRQPTPAVLRELERIGDRRAEIQAVVAGDDREAAVRLLLLATLDDMEEELCLRGRRAPAVVAGWRRLARYASFGRDG